jgi:hypothetical protein
VRAGDLVLTVREPHRTADPTFPRQARVTVSWPRHATILVAP